MGFNLGFKGLIGHNTGLLLACLLDITRWEDIYILWGYVITPFVGNAGLRRKPQSTFCVSERIYGHHLELCYNLVQNMGHKGPVFRPRCIRPGRARTQTLFYSILGSFSNVSSLYCINSHDTLESCPEGVEVYSPNILTWTCQAM